MAERDRFDDSNSRRTDGLSDLLRGAISSGVRSVFLTEEGLRSLLSELFPKELGTYLRGQIDATKKEVYQAFVTEFRQFLQGIHLGEEIKSALSSLELDVRVQVRVKEPLTKRTKKK